MKKLKLTVEMMSNYMSFLRGVYDDLCKSEDVTIKQRAYRKVCKDMFDGLTYGLNEYKLDILHNTIECYRLEKQK